MKRTRHFLSRMSHRGVTRKMVELVLELGEPNGDKIICSPKVLKAFIGSIDRQIMSYRQVENKLISTRLRQSRQVALKLLDKGGLIVVAEGGTLITTYHYGNRRWH